MAVATALKIPTFYRPREEIEIWSRRAAPGDAADYAVGPAVDQREPVVRLVAELIKARLVVPVKRRAEVNGAVRLVHSIQRVRDGGAALAKRRIARDEEWESSDVGRMFLLLVRHANLGMPLPSYAELGERLGLRDRQAARYLITKLENMGRIRCGTGGEARTVTIVETGASTAARPARR